MASPPPVPPITNQFPIVDGMGKPTDYFIRYLQERGLDIDGRVTPSQVAQMIADWSAGRFVNTNFPLAGGGSLSGDLTLDHEPSGVTPGVYGDATNVPQFYVDADGHITGVMEVPISGGGGGGGTPSVRSSGIQAGSADSYVVNFPLGSAAGDVACIFAGHAFEINTPAGWGLVDSSTGTYWNGAVFAKILTAGDISTGSVTVTTAGSYNGVIAIVTLIGSGVKGLRARAALRSSSGAASVPLALAGQFSPDLVLVFGSTRLATTAAFAVSTSLQAINATEASGAVGSQTNANLFGEVDTVSFGGSGAGYYLAAIAIAG